MRPGVLFAAGAACAVAGTGDLGLLGFIVPQWLGEADGAEVEVSAPVVARARQAPPPGPDLPGAVPAAAAAPAPAAPLPAAAPVPLASPVAQAAAQAPAPVEVSIRVAAPPPAAAGPALTLRFAPEQVEVDELAARSLEGLVARLDEGARLRVEGHADASGREEGHQYFSRTRARAVARKLLQLGVAPPALSYRGLGATHPLDPDHTLEAMARNRRVEVFVDEAHR